jgi:hypothetical protein
MNRYFKSAQLLLTVLAMVALSVTPLRAQDAAQFAAFPKEQLEKCPKSWPFFRKLEKEGVSVAYLIVPRWKVDSSEHQTESKVWAIFEPASENAGVGYVEPLDLPSGVLDELESDFAQGALRDVYGKDVAVLDDSALWNLFRLCQFNSKDSPFESPTLRVLKSFAQDFLISERKWYLSPRGKRRMVFISELSQKETTLVRVVIPGEDGSVFSFRVVQANRAVLRNTLQVLRGEQIPVTITLPIKDVNTLLGDLDLAEIAGLLDVRLIGRRADLIKGFDQVKVSDGKVWLSGTFLRDALYATDVQITLSPGSPYRLVWKDDSGSDHISSVQTFKIPALEPEADAPPLKFDLAVARLPTAPRLRSDDIWHHEVSFGEAQISRDLPEIKERQAFFSADLKSPVDAELLFTDPLEYVRKLGSRIGRKVLGLEAREQRLFALEMAQTDIALEALWQYLQIARFLSKEYVEVVVVKNVPSPMRRWRWVTSADHMSSWVTSYLGYRIRDEEQRSKKPSGISVREVEAPAQEDHITHTVSILLVPQQGRQEKLP